jgi:hypothetical protein
MEALRAQRQRLLMHGLSALARVALSAQARIARSARAFLSLAVDPCAGHRRVESYDGRVQEFQEGSIIMVPLRTTGFAPGVIARCGKSPILFGYFFHLRLAEPVVPAEPLVAARASRLVRFADLGLVDGTWHLVGTIAGWDRKDWPMPDFQQVGRGASVGIRVRCSENDLVHELSREPATIAELNGLPSADIFGPGAVEVMLTTDHDPDYRYERPTWQRPG